VKNGGMTHLVRPAKVSDADAIGVLHVQVWRETYAGLMSAEFLQSLSPVERAEMWHGWLTRGAPGAYVCEEEQAVVGFGLCGAQRTRTLPNHRGEIYAINVLRRAQGRGLGRALMQTMGRSLDERGLTPMTLLVLLENVSAQQFYQRLGGRVIGEVVTNFGGARLREQVYCWDDLSLVAGKR
jgi:ribosomal protein S18 acetylase RimI-like enzyme